MPCKVEPTACGVSSSACRPCRLGNDHERVEIEQLRYASLVMLHLVERAERVRLFLVRIFQLEQHDWKSVQVNDDVRPPIVLPRIGN